MAEPMNILGVNSPVDEEKADDKQTYWASLPAADLGAKIVDHIDDYDQYTRTFGMLWLWRRSYYTYYKNYFRGGRILKAGDVGQYRTMSVNHYHSIVQGLLTLIT